MYPGCVFIKSASCDHALISVASSAGSMVNTLISTIGPPLICICSASVTFESSSLNLGMSTSPLVVICLCVDGGVCVLNRSKEDWHRQFLSGTTVFVQKTVPMETVRALNYRT